MKRNALSFHQTLILAAAVLIAGCSDPSKNVEKAATSAPQQAAGAPARASKEYVVRAESKIDFVGSKVTGSHEGGFKNFAGKIQAAGGKVTGGEIKISTRSLWSDNDRLTGHLKSADFFDVEKFPVATFTVTSVEPEGTQHKVTGNLDLHGVTKSISFPATIQVSEEAVTVKAEFAINRKDFNINYPGRPNDLIRDNVVIKLDVKATPGPPRPEDQLATS